MKRIGAVALLLLLSIPPAGAVVSSVTTVKAIATGKFSDGAGDQVSALLATLKGPIAIGTVEGASAEWLTGEPLGGSDGFITKFSTAGIPTWSARLGSAKDEIATAATIGATGDIWVAGASAQSGELTTLMVWQISSGGKILNTFSTLAPTIIYPHSITWSTSGLKISGEQFSITMDTTGKFGNFGRAPAPIVAPKLITYKGSKYSWKIYTGKGPLLGIPSFRPKSAQTIYYKILNTSSSVKVAYQFPIAPLFIAYQRDIGLYAISEVEDGFALSLLK